MTSRRTPDLVILCSRSPNVVVGRVFAGVLLTRERGSRQMCATDLRQGNGQILFDVGDRLVDKGWQIGHQASIRCDCGRLHGSWAPEVVRRLRGRTTTDEVEQMSSDYWDSLD